MHFGIACAQVIHARARLASYAAHICQQSPHAPISKRPRSLAWRPAPHRQPSQQLGAEAVADRCCELNLAAPGAIQLHSFNVRRPCNRPILVIQAVSFAELYAALCKGDDAVLGDEKHTYHNKEAAHIGGPIAWRACDHLRSVGGARMCG